MENNFPYILIHELGCKKPAFYYLKLPVYGDPLSSANARLLDGSIPASGENVICGSCGEILTGEDMKIEYFIENKDS